MHKELVPEGQTVNAPFRKNVMNRVFKRIRHDRPSLVLSGDWILLHENTPSHNLVTVRAFLGKKSVTVLHHP